MPARPPARRALQALTVAVSAYYALWACAPAATMRPMTLDLDHPNEFGVGASGTAPVPGGTPRCAGSGELFPCNGGFDGQIWYQHRFGERFSFGGTIYGGQSSLVGGGVQGRFHWVELDRFRFGTDLEAGWLWGAVGLPVSVRLVDDLWLYTNPSIGVRYTQSARLPLGVAWGVTDQWWIQAEGAWGYDLLSGPAREPDYGMWTAGVSGAYRF